MRKSIPVVGVAFLLVFVVGALAGESRLWTSMNGQSVEAEYVCTQGDSVVLRKGDGAEVKVELSSLSPADRRYAALLNPPRLEIEVSPKTDRSNSGGSKRIKKSAQVQTERTAVEVEIKKSSSADYALSLKVQLFVLGQQEQVEGYGVLDRKQASFTFTRENGHAFSVSSDEIEVKQREDQRKSKGVEYVGYLVVVTDESGEVIQVKANKSVFEEQAEVIMEAEEGARFDKDFNLMKKDKSKQKDKRKA